MKKKRIISATAAVLLAVATPMSSMAATWDIGNGDITVNAKVEGQTVTQGEQVDVPDEDPVITGTTVENNLTINAEEDATANVTLSDVDMDLFYGGKAAEDVYWNGDDDTDLSDMFPDYENPAIVTSGEGNVNIEVDGENHLIAGYNSSGIEKNNEGKLTITDENETDGSLYVTGYGDGNGISCNKGDLTISGGTVGVGGYESDGGGGEGYKGIYVNKKGKFTIEGGDVSVDGEVNGINCGNLIILGGTIYCDSFYDDAIYASKSVSITGGYVTLYHDPEYDDDEDYEDEYGAAYDTKDIDSKKITISGDTVIKCTELDLSTVNMENLSQKGCIAYYTLDDYEEDDDDVEDQRKVLPYKIVYKDKNGKTVTATSGISKLEAVEPTCTKAGHTAGYKVKSRSFYSTIPATGHTVVTDEAVAPTCESTGLTEGSHCSVCGETIVAQKVVKALGHDYESEVTTEPTYTTTGVRTYTCKNDSSHTYTEVIPTLSHTIVRDEAVAPTCESTGLTEGSHCSDCGQIFVEQEVIPMLGHDYESTVTTEPTCTEAGVKTYTCKNDASHTYTEEIPALGHTVVTDEAVAPTCESTGLTEGSHCSVCGEVIVAQETVEALGHAYDDGVVTTEATCTESGVKTFTCANDASHTYTEEIPALGHTVVTDEAVDATCENTGLTEGAHCSVCGEVLTAQETVKALGHKWSEWTVSKEATSTENGEKVKTCSVCGQQQTKVIPATAIVPENNNTVVNNTTTNTTVNAKAYDGSTPKTGDNSNIALWGSALALSIAGILAVVRKKFRRVK